MNMTDNRFDNLVVVKRSGQRVSFNAPKIAIAIKSAFDSISGNYTAKDINKIYENVLNYIAQNYQNRKTINVETIQNIIEDILKQEKYIDIYHSFSEYRNKRAESRKAFSLKQEHKLVKIIEKISNYDFTINNNLCPEEMILSLGTTIASELTKIHLLDNKYINAHEEGNINIHNIDYLITGMLSYVNLDIKKETIDNLYSIIKTLFLVTKENFDEVNLSSIPELIEPFTLNYFKMHLKERLLQYLTINGVIDYIDTEELEKKVEELETINFDLKVFESFILNQSIYNLFNQTIIDVQNELKHTLFYFFKTFLLELNSFEAKYSFSLGSSNSDTCIIITNVLLDVIAILPPLNNVTLIYKLRDLKYFNYGKMLNLINENKNIAFSFTDTSYNKDENSDIEYFANGYRIFENVITKENSSVGRMINATTSINLVRIAFNSKNKTDFLKELDNILDLTKNELISTFEYLSTKSKENYKVLFHDNLIDDEKLLDSQKIRKIIKHGVLNIGLVGLNESSYLMNNQIDDNFIYDICKYIYKKALEFTEELKLNFVISETKEKNVLSEFMRLDKAIYGIYKGVTDKDSYTTLSDLVYNDEMENKLQKIGQISKYLNGGIGLKVSFSKKITESQITDLFKTLSNSNIGFIKIVRGGKG